MPGSLSGQPLAAKQGEIASTPSIRTNAPRGIPASLQAAI
jgi:hypothetical protein